MSIGEAINFCIEKAPMTVSEHEQLATWLRRLQSYDNETPITVEFLGRHFKDCSSGGDRFSTTKEQSHISVDVFVLEDCNTFKVIVYPDNVAFVKTLGQLCKFLSIFNVENLINNFYDTQTI